MGAQVCERRAPNPIHWASFSKLVLFLFQRLVPLFFVFISKIEGKLMIISKQNKCKKGWTKRVGADLLSDSPTLLISTPSTAAFFCLFPFSSEQQHLGKLHSQSAVCLTQTLGLIKTHMSKFSDINCRDVLWLTVVKHLVLKIYRDSESQKILKISNCSPTECFATEGEENGKKIQTWTSFSPFQIMKPGLL